MARIARSVVPRRRELHRLADSNYGLRITGPPRDRRDDPRLIAVDSAMYPAATLAHDEFFPHIAPSMDLMMSFHVPGADSEWLLVDALSPLLEGGLVAGKASIWSGEGRLLGSAMQQMLQRP